MILRVHTLLVLSLALATGCGKKKASTSPESPGTETLPEAPKSGDQPDSDGGGGGGGDGGIVTPIDPGPGPVLDVTPPTVDVGADVATSATASVNATTHDQSALTFAWTKVSGPGELTFGSPKSEDTQITASADGVYVVRLTATDTAGNKGSDELTFTSDATPPTVNAGGDLLTNAGASLDGTGADLSPLTFAWTQTSGPGVATFGAPAAEDSTVSVDADGVYVLRLTTTDALGNSAFDEMTLTRDSSTPTVAAGSDQISATAIALDGAASDNAALTLVWTQQSGPGTVSFGSASAEDTSASASADGTYVLRLTATDTAGNSSFDELTFTHDSTAPSVNAGADRVNSGLIAVDASTSDATALTYAWSKRSGPGSISFGAATSEDTTINAGADGVYVLRLTATDAAGNSAFDEMSFTRDSTVPTVDAGADALAAGLISLNGASSDATSLTYAWSKISGPGSVAFGNASAEDTTANASIDGAYVLRLTVTDQAGNSAFDELSYTKDASAPTVNAGADQIATGQISIDASATDASAMTYAWSKISGPGSVTFGSASAEDTTASASADGNYVLRLTVTDQAGNASFDELTYTRDATAPTVDAGSDRIAAGQITTNATSSDATALVYAWTQVSGPGSTTFGSPAAENSTASADADGVYTLRLTATDAAGNSSFSDMSYTLDATAPAVNVGADVNDVTSHNFDASTLDATALSFAWTTISGPGTITFGTPAAEDTSATADFDGSYVLRLTVTDAAGNSAFDEVTYTLDSGNPVVDAGADALSSSSISLDATASDGTALTFAWSKQSGPGLITFGSPGSEDTTASASADGVYVLRLTATDAAGNSAFDEMTYTFDSTAPTVDAGADALANTQISMDATSSDATSMTYAWTKQSGPGSITFGSATAEDTTASADTDGDYVLRLTVTDAAGNSAFDEMTFSRDTVNPVVDAGTDATTAVSHAQNATATDTHGMTYAWTKLSGPGTINFGSASAEDTTISATADGNYALRLTVTDLAGNSASDDLALTWDSTAPSVNVGADSLSKVQISIDATTSDATALSYSWSKQSGPGAVTFGTATAEDSTASADTDGAYVLRLTVTDAAGNSAFDEMTYTLDTTNPSVNAGADAISNSQISQNATATDVHAMTYAWSKQSGPGTITFGTATAEDSTISANADGDYVLRLTVTDAAGNSAFDEMTYTVDTAAPVVNAGTDATSSVQISQNATATDAHSMTYAWTKQSGTGAVTFGSASAEDTTISANADGSYVIRLTVTDAAGNSAFDDMTLLRDASVPTVNAGSDRLANALISIDATASDATAMTYAWTKQSGPGTVTFGSASAEDTTANATSDGAYVLRLTVTDAAGNSAFDELTFTRDTANPVVNAGVDATSATQISQNATATDGSSMTYAWTKQSGPGAVTFGSASAEDTTISAGADGVYVIRLTVTDGAGNSAFDEMSYTRDTTNPTVNAGTDFISNAMISINATTSDATTLSYAWTKQSGPGSITFGTASAEDTTASASADGVYVLRLTVTDAAGNSAFDELTFTRDTAAPVVNAGVDATNSGLISQNATATDGQAMTYAWTKQSGPGSITFGTAAAEDTTISSTVDGVYVIRLTVTDAAGNSAFDEMNYTRDATAPTVNAGADAISNTQISINATTSDATAMTYAWTKQSGPGTVTFGTASAEDTTANGSADGAYVLRLTVTDAAGNSSFDELTYTRDTGNPVVNAGIDQLKNALFSQDATATDASATTYAWTKQSGPGTITFGTSTAEDTTVTASADGSYVLRLTVTDAAANSAFDEFTLTWDTTPPTATYAGVPSSPSANLVLDVTVAGTGVVSYKSKVGAAGSTDCTSATGYGSEQVVATHVTDNIAGVADGSVKLCLVGKDAVGNWQTYATSTSYSWTKDTTPPTFPSGQVITTNSLTPVSFSMAWSAASDAVTAQASLLYRVCSSLSNNLLTEADMESANCTVVQDYTAAITTANLASLTSKTLYYTRVIVKDQAGNKALYTLKTQRTLPVVHVSYYNSTNTDIMYAVNSTGSFVTSIIDTTGPSAGLTYNSLALDSANKPHSVYVRNSGTRNTVYYSEKTGVAWSTPAAIDVLSAATYTSMAIGSDDKVHVAWYESALNGTNTRDLKYGGKPSGGAWTVEKIYTTSTSGEYNNITVDSSNYPRVSFYKNSTQDDLMYADRIAGLNGSLEWSNFSTTPLDSTGVTGLWTSLAVDGNGKNHISYYNSTNGDLKYSSSAAGATYPWASRTIDSTGTVGLYSKIAVETSGSTVTVHILYQDATNFDLKHAVCTATAPAYCTDAGASWSTETVMNGATPAPTWIEVNLDAYGTMHIVYDTGAGTSLKYVYGTFGAWSTPATVATDANSTQMTPAIKAER